MKTDIFLVADFAEKASNGKLNILGIFDRIYAQEFPVKHRTMYLVARIIANLGEYNTIHDVKILFLDEDGNELGGVDGQVTWTVPAGVDRAIAVLTLEVADTILAEPGRYEFRLLINKQVHGVIPIDVIQLEKPESPAEQ